MTTPGFKQQADKWVDELSKVAGYQFDNEARDFLKRHLEIEHQIKSHLWKAVNHITTAQILEAEK